MDKVLEYIMLNYTWFLLAAIIILLAIIGRYADKTNFGQGKNKDTEEKQDEIEKINIEKEVEEPALKENENITKEEKIEEPKQTDIIQPVSNKVDSNTLQSSIPQVESTNFNLSQQQSVNSNLYQPIELSDIKEEQERIFEEGFEKLDKEFDLVLPQKQVIDTDLLEDIDNLSLDNTQKISINDIPDLDDVDLPEIKKLKPEQEDVWKF